MKKILLLTLLIIYCGIVSAEYCYQENANVSTACGGLSTGSYRNATDAIDRTTNFWISPLEQLWDGNWETANYGFPYNASFYVNYTKPLTALNQSYLQVKYHDTTRNLTINQSCFDQPTLQFKITSVRDGSFIPVPYSIMVRCKNATDWINMLMYVDATDDGSDHDFYEEAMWWNITIVETTPTIGEQFAANMSEPLNQSMTTFISFLPLFVIGIIAFIIIGLLSMFKGGEFNFDGSMITMLIVLLIGAALAAVIFFIIMKAFSSI